MTDLDKRITDACHRIEELYYETEGHCCVSFSGGKDSTVMLALIKMSISHRMSSYHSMKPTRERMWFEVYEPMRQEMLRKYRPNSKLIRNEIQMNLFQLD